MLIKNKSKTLLKSFSYDAGPYKIFDKKIISFLNEVSKTILNFKSIKFYPDLATFGFWCRENNMKSLANMYLNDHIMIGRGCALHICPSNVPMNFAYSFVFGLISGNNNIIKIPSRNFTQVRIFFKVLNKVLKKKKYFGIKKKFVFVKYSKDNEISSDLSKLADVRLIWGGNNTVKLFKKFETNSRCLDLCFSNRVSGALINTQSLKKLSSNEFEKLIFKFYNDCYLMDQQGCSSPQVIFWHGKKNQMLIEKFWEKLANIINNKYSYDRSLANKKIEIASELILNEKNLKSINSKNLRLLRFKRKKITSLNNINYNFGTFLEADIKKIDEIKNLIKNEFQTLIYYGVSKNILKNFIIQNNLKGIDRIVPFGRAFDMGLIWDGFDIVRSMSRIVAE
jgi:hypothetical protein